MRNQHQPNKFNEDATIGATGLYSAACKTQLETLDKTWDCTEDAVRPSCFDATWASTVLPIDSVVYWPGDVAVLRGVPGDW